MLLASLLVTGCQTKDERTRILEQRARWNVTLNSWAPGDGGYMLDTRVSGPPNSPLEQLSVRVDFLDAAGHSVDHAWRTYDLKQVERGGPKDFVLHVPSSAAAVEGVTLQLVLDPTPEDEPHIRELAGAGASAN